MPEALYHVAMSAAMLMLAVLLGAGKFQELSMLAVQSDIVNHNQKRNSNMKALKVLVWLVVIPVIFGVAGPY